MTEMKMTKGVVFVVVALLALAVTSTALAAVTVKQLPTISFSGASATVSGGNFSGLGNIDAIGELTVEGLATYTCTNPQGHPRIR